LHSTTVPARPEAAPDLGDESCGMREVLYDEDREDPSERRVREEERRADVVHVERHVHLVASGLCPCDLDHARCPVDTGDVITAPRECECSSRRCSQAALSRSYMNRKNQRGAVTLQLADVRLLAGVTLVVSPRCQICRR